MLRIKSLTINSHSFLKGIPFDLTNPSETDVSNYYSVIIGPNGTGKSNVLAYLLMVLNEIVLVQENKKEKTTLVFSLIYELEDNIYSIQASKRDGFECKVNEAEVTIRDIVLPEKWLGVSVTINDKFPILQEHRKELIPQYKYLGIRSARNNAFVSNITKNTIVSLAEALTKGKIEVLSALYGHLGLNTKIAIVFGQGKMLKLSRDQIKNITQIAVREPFDRYVSASGYSVSYRLNRFRRFLGDRLTIRNTAEFLKSKARVSHNSRFQITYEIDLQNGETASNLTVDWPILKQLLDLEILKVENFFVFKQSAFSFEEASSGESHLLGAFHGIIANLENNSLLLVDEPEISLHPNWQLCYIDILKSIVNWHTGVNVIISTHSHFIISGLKQVESRITALKRNADGSIAATPLDYETFTWSPDEILYKIFGLRTNRNVFFENDLLKLAYLLNNNSREFGEVREIIEKLEGFKISPEDPLTMLIEKAKEYLRINNA